MKAAEHAVKSQFAQPNSSAAPPANAAAAPAPAPPPPIRASRPPPPPKAGVRQVRALYDYEGDAVEDLPIAEGENLTVLESGTFASFPNLLLETLPLLALCAAWILLDKSGRCHTRCRPPDCDWPSHCARSLDRLAQVPEPTRLGGTRACFLCPVARPDMALISRRGGVSAGCCGSCRPALEFLSKTSGFAPALARGRSSREHWRLGR